MQRRQLKLFDGMESPMTSYFDNDTNGLEAGKAAVIARLEETELQHLHHLEQKRHQIQVTVVYVYLCAMNLKFE